MANGNQKALSHQAIVKLKPNDKVLCDCNENRGLRVECSKTGKTRFIYRYRRTDGKLVEMTIGYFPQMQLAEARLELQKLKKIRESGQCPRELREQQKLKELQLKKAQENKSNFTIKKMIDLYLTEYIQDRQTKDGKVIEGARKPKGQNEVRRTLYADPVKILGNQPATDVTRQNIIDLIKDICERGANVQAGNVLRELNAAYEYALGTGKIDNNFINPVVLAKNSLQIAKFKLTPKRGTRVLSELELKQFLKWLPICKLPDKAKHIFLLTLYTGCRTGEWCNAKWNDINFEKRTFHIKFTKTETERYVQLTKTAINLLKCIKEKSSTDDYLFTSNYTGKALNQKKLTEYTWLLRRHNEMLNIPRWTPHDLRRTVRTGLSRLRCPNEVAEAILGHSRKGIEGTYDLYRYDDECREWLEKWDNYLDELQQNSK